MNGAPDETHESLWRLIFGPLIWAAHFLLSYVTGAIGCARFADAHEELAVVRLLVVLYTLTALALIAASARSQWRQYHHGAAAQLRRDAGGREDRHRFLGLAGLLLCGLSAVAVIYTATVAALIRSCA